MTITTSKQTLTERQTAVLEAATRVQINGAVNAGDIARALGEPGSTGTNRVNSVIQTLTKRGLWPFKRLQPNEIQQIVRDRDPEITLMLDCYERLAAMSPADRERILGYLCLRFGWTLVTAETGS